MAAPERQTTISYSINRARLKDEDLVAILVNQAKHPERTMQMTFPNGKTATYNPYHQMNLNPNNLFAVMDQAKKIEIMASS